MGDLCLICKNEPCQNTVNEGRRGGNEASTFVCVLERCTGLCLGPMMRPNVTVRDSLSLLVVLCVCCKISASACKFQYVGVCRGA